MSDEHWRERYAYLLTWWRHFARRWELIVPGVLALLAVAVWPLPQWMVRHEYWEWMKHPEEYAKLVDDYRKTLVQIIGGAFLLYTLYLTQRRTKATEKTLLATQESLKMAQESLKITKETQVTDRFTKAITQLGATDSQSNKQLEVRFGGIYSLERIARDSPDDHWPIMEILTAYVRKNSPWPKGGSKGSDALEKPPVPEEDIQAIMTVIGRRKSAQDKGSLDLTRSDLRGLDLSNAYLDNAGFTGTHLGGAFLYQASLRRAFFNRANLEEATLLDAYMEHAHLESAQLEGAHLEGTVGLSQEQLDSADGDDTTQLPQGLNYPNRWPRDPDGEDSQRTARRQL